MTHDVLTTIITAAAAILIAIFFGAAQVYFFNRMPGKWLVNYGEEPDEELKNPTVQRLKSTPWKYIFTGFYIVIGIWLGIRNPYFAMPALITIWLLVEMSICDIKYRIIPDQLIILLVVCAIGFITQMEGNVKSMLFGALTGLGIMMLIFLISKLLFKKQGVGGADIKIYAALGLSMGTVGIVTIFVISTIISGIHMGIMAARKNAGLKESKPMVPYIAAATAVYLCFMYNNNLFFSILL